jgi:signal transduction histidine kinase
MQKLTDDELILELKARFEFQRKALNDLTGLTRQLETTNRKLQESEALKSHFLANIRNEINNPLTSIIGLSGQLMEGAGAPEHVAMINRMIYCEAFNLDFQLQNILMAAELEAGESRPSFNRVDVVGVLGRILDLLGHKIAEKGVTVRREAPETLLFTTDPQNLHLMLINLLTNAIEFSPVGGEIVVTLSVGAEGLEVSVRDQGPGVDPKHRERIFDRFRQVDESSTKMHPGHGLGLSIVKALAELFGGCVLLGDADGGGTLFRFTLPKPAVPVSDVLSQEGNLFFFDQPETF